MELEILSPIEQLPAVKFNKEEIKQEISRRVQYYTTIVVSEETMKNSKTDLANLRKFKEGFEEKRKELKKKFLKPYEDFEKEYKEIIELIDKPINLINEQVQKLELEQKEKKKEFIKNFYSEVAQDILPVVPFEKIFKEKWINKTTTLKSIKDEIFDFVLKFKTGYETILNVDLKFKDQVIDKFIQTLDLPLALTENKRLLEQEKKVNVVEQTYQKQIQEKKETENKIEQLNNKFGKKEGTVETKIEPKKFSVSLKFTATCDQLKSLKKFLTDNYIQYEKIGE